MRARDSYKFRKIDDEIAGVSPKKNFYFHYMLILNCLNPPILNPPSTPFKNLK